VDENFNRNDEIFSWTRTFILGPVKQKFLRLASKENHMARQKKFSFPANFKKLAFCYDKTFQKNVWLILLVCRS